MRLVLNALSIKLGPRWRVHASALRMLGSVAQPCWIFVSHGESNNHTGFRLRP